ncbi:hypothetical protein VKT23_008084 [Stygiomarasmius scandens]|uniref:Uncharacterized protein n=1 Tax=Marasmiellus scandens TaxID=2682957 RepID=A0ABR1IK60_9AGAR
MLIVSSSTLDTSQPLGRKNSTSSCNEHKDEPRRPPSMFEELALHDIGFGEHEAC